MTWLSTAPIVGTPTYPVALDAAESALAVADQQCLRVACAALAPQWHEFSERGLTSPRPDALRTHDLPEQSDVTLEHYLFRGLAQALASMGPRFGLILRHPQRYDHAGLVFLESVCREARLTGFHLALQAPMTLVSDRRFHRLLTDVVPVITPNLPRPTATDVSDRATEYVALCPHGVPEDVLAAITNVEPIAYECEGPAGRRWWYLPVSSRRRILRRLGVERRRDLHRELFQAWDPARWDYLRRAGHAIEARDHALLIAQHVPYTIAIAPIGRDYLYRHFMGLAKAVDGQQVRGTDARSVLVGAGRLALTTWSGGGFGAAVRHFRRALPFCANPVDEVALLYEYANGYALQKTGAALRRARAIYSRAYAVLEQITDPVDRARMEIRLANGLALVEYHDGNSASALTLERRGQSLADSLERDRPEIATWAKRLLYTNTAKLLEKRFGDTQAAIELLERVEGLCDAGSREANTVDLARLNFDRADYRRVVHLLSGVCEGGQSVMVDDRRELFARFMFAISLVAIGRRRRARRQLGRLAHLCYVLDCPGGSQLVLAVGRSCAR